MALSNKRSACFVALAFAAACGSVSSSESTGPFGMSSTRPGAFPSASDQDAGQTAIIDGGGTTTTEDGGWTVSGDGGTQPLTQDEIDLLRDSSCAGWQGAPEPLTAVLMLVVDVSGSMDDTADGTGGRTKWEVTEEALQDAIDSLPAGTAVGMLFFPNRSTESNPDGPPVDASECVATDELISIDLLGGSASDHRADLAQALSSATPEGGTPTLDAYLVALQELESWDGGGSKYMLLITDGQPTFSEGCVGTGRTNDPVDEQPVIDAIAQAENDDMRTFVIGSPGSEETVSVGEDARPWLSQAAEEGNTAQDDCEHDGTPTYCHFDMVDEPDFSAGLRRALSTISGEIGACAYAIPEPPEDQTINPSQVNVVYTPGDGDPLLILPNSEEDCDIGWHYAESDSGHQLVLCKETCNEVQSDPEAALELMFGCASGVVPIE